MLNSFLDRLQVILRRHPLLMHSVTFLLGLVATLVLLLNESAPTILYEGF